MAKRIVIMAGGTGGHVFPALAVAEWLIEQGWQVSWLGTPKGLESRVVPERGIELDTLSVAGVRGKGLVSKLTALGKLLVSCWQALRILRRRKPDVVLGMGGYVAGPGGLVASLLGIPLVIHEQNRVPGTTNKLLARYARRVLEAFPGSFNAKVNAHCTGNPLRKAFVAADEKPDYAPGAPTRILIIGGSQGAKVLNETVPEALREVAAIEVRHQTGVAMQTQVAERYQTLGIQADVAAFFDDMVASYRWADLIICRAGAMTVSEVAALGLPAIFVPLPGAIDDHQAANARYLTDAGAGILLPQHEMNADSLAEKINEVRQRLDEFGRAARRCARLDATVAVASHLIEAAR